jgi:ribosomal protein S18 acetylase RimI-like enzyme
MSESEWTGPGEEQLVVRPARPEDRDAVEAFCATIWDGEDYVPSAWESWLHDDRGALLVAALAGRPVGLIHWRMVSDDEAWLEGIRVDPAQRRQGIARLLVSQALAGADGRGANIARLLTSAGNGASKGLVARFGFERVAEVVRYRGAALTAPSGVSARPLSPLDFERVWAWLEQSNLRPFLGGLELDHWSARALGELALRGYLANGYVWALEEWGTLQAVAIVAIDAAQGDEPARLESRYTDGTADALGRLGLALRRIAAERQCNEIVLWLPNLLILRDAMEGAGFRGGDEPMEVYARGL